MRSDTCQFDSSGAGASVVRPRQTNPEDERRKRLALIGERIESAVRRGAIWDALKYEVTRDIDLLKREFARDGGLLREEFEHDLNLVISEMIEPEQHPASDGHARRTD